MFPAAANAKPATLASNDDDAMFSSIGMLANASFNEFFLLSMPSADADTAIDSPGAGMPSTMPASDAVRNGSGFSAVTTGAGATSPSFQAVNAHRLAIGNHVSQDTGTSVYSAQMAGPEVWAMLVIGVGLVAFRLRRRPDMNSFSYA
jgi:hypothetical protein